MIDKFKTICKILINLNYDLLYKEEKIEEFLLMLIENKSFLTNTDYFFTHSKLEAAKTFIFNNFTKNLTLEKISEYSNISKYHLVRLFKNIYGITPYEYLINLRISAAKQLILKGRLLCEVVLEVGFNDQSHLNRFFKRIIACTPGEYKKSLLN